MSCSLTAVNYLYTLHSQILTCSLSLCPELLTSSCPPDIPNRASGGDSHVSPTPLGPSQAAPYFTKLKISAETLPLTVLSDLEVQPAGSFGNVPSETICFLLIWYLSRLGITPTVSQLSSLPPGLPSQHRRTAQ